MTIEAILANLRTADALRERARLSVQEADGLEKHAKLLLDSLSDEEKKVVAERRAPVAPTAPGKK